MKVTVQTTKSTFDFDVTPLKTVKQVMEMVVEKYPVPSWANQALLYVSEPKAAFPAKKTLDTVGITDGAVLKFTYAKHLTKKEKMDMMLKGQIPIADAPAPVTNLSVASAPTSWYAFNGAV
mmetsp:Transcript_109308/g.189686  ORF Transcript_109308/g.189686 Transcript_109308/m.189686 type:complete len:121 (-) Transcript_109308:82-444(-)